MLVKLRNFRQYKDQTFSLPDTGLVRVSGPSGSGKTTLLLAIRFALTGTGKLLKPWFGGGSPRVDLEMPRLDLKVIRTQNPTTLQVFYKGQEFRDAAAQQEIFKIFGIASDEEFACSSYIGQRMSGALLTMSPADMLRLIQKLAFGDEDPEEQKKKITTKLTSLEKDLLVEKGLKDSIAQDIANKIDSINAIVISDLVPPVSEVEMTEINSSISELNTLMTKKSADLALVQSQLNSDGYQKLENAQAMIFFIEKDITSTKLDLRGAEEHLASLPVPEPIDKTIRWKLEAKKQYLKLMNDAKKLVAEAKAVFPDFQTGSLGQFLDSYIPKIEAELQATADEITKMKQKLQELLQQVVPQPCPVCAAALRVEGGKIHIHDGHHLDMGLVDSLKEELVLLTNQMNSLRSVRDQAMTYRTKSQTIKQQIGTDPLPELKTAEDIQKFDRELEEKEILFLKQTKDIDFAKQRYAMLKFSLGKFMQEKMVLEKTIKQYAGLPDKSELKAQYEVLLAETTELRNKISALFEVKKLIDEYEKKKQKNDINSAVKVELENQLADLQNRLKLQESETEKILVEIGGWSRLKELSDLAALQAIEKKLDDINGNARTYLSQMFPDDGTSVKILNTSKTKKGEERAKLSLDITHKGSEVGKDLDPVSGGELDRIVMAFQLAMSDLYSSPILMVDEGFVGADVEKTLDLCLQTLKSFSSGKLVLVVQHGAGNDHFDEVISLGDDCD